MIGYLATNALETVRADSEPVEESKHVAVNFVMRKSVASLASVRLYPSTGSGRTALSAKTSNMFAQINL